ncbi:MAG: hypothetical protein FWF02_09560 [Micrococcales bacterium]|nr:hypothetical protein [Micrococcales bacterium]MCL2667935.1 hypothetical protein [Micrococcales bacterium]
MTLVNAAARPSCADPAVETQRVSLVATPTRTELVDGAVAAWRAALVDEAGGSARSDIDLLADAALDLTSAHPSGMAQLFAGRPTKLSNLVRDAGALASARRRARAVTARASTTAQQYGLAPTALAIGVATWTAHPAPEQVDDMAALAAATSTSRPSPPAETGEPARTVRVPVLLRPIQVVPRGSAHSDFELTLEPTVEVNPVLARALRARGALLDPVALAASTFADGGFDPRGALDRLTALGEAVLRGFELNDRRIVGTFVHPGQVLVDDLDALAGLLERHEVVAALAGSPEATKALRVTVPDPPPGDRDLADERGVGDLDDAQRHVLDMVGSGAHLFVDAPSGADVAGTVAAIVSEAAAAGKTVLYVPGSRRGTLTLAEALDRHGIEDLLLDVPTGPAWRLEVTRRLLSAMTLAVPEVDLDELSQLQDQTGDLRDRLAAYVEAMHQVREPWGVSAFDALQHLAALTSTRPVPRTTARLSSEAVRIIDANRRAELGADLRRAAQLGAFLVRPVDTAWYGADLHSDVDAEVALTRVERLLEDSLPALSDRAGQIYIETGLNPAASLDEWATQLSLLGDIRDSLDLFRPEVFERDPSDLVAATASKAWRASHGVEMGVLTRRRLRNQARDLVRPGRPVVDLHAALVQVQQRRQAWRAQCPSEGWPRLPHGFELVEDDFAAVRRDVEALEAVLSDDRPRLSGLTLDHLVDRLTLLRFDAPSLNGLPERTTLLATAQAAGLGPLIDDLRARRTPPDLAAAEVELAWWATVFELILSQDPALAGYDGAALDTLSERYAEVDRALVALRAPQLLHQVVTELQARLRRNRAQGEALFVELVEESLGTLRDTVERYPEITRHLRPVVAASPLLVPAVAPPARQVDLVVLDAAGHLSTAVAVPAIARGRQVVVVGDARCASRSALRDLAEVLPVVALRADVARRDPHLTAFLADHGYEGVLTPVPLPQSAPLVALYEVDGTGMPDATGIVDSTRAEVDQVLALVTAHVDAHADESLAVVTVTARHADAVRDAIDVETRRNSALSAFCDSRRSEPFVVVDLPNVAGLTRDTVILSLGLGRTPHRRVLHSFATVSDDGGDALLLDALGSTRHQLDVVSCFGKSDLDPHRLRGAGPRLLADLLDFARRRGDGLAEVDRQTVGDDTGAPTAGADPLLLDIAERLWQHGLDVELDHGLVDGVRIPLVVGHPGLPGRFLVSVLTDDDAYVAEPSVRTRDRLAADRLRALGWTVVRIWSAAAFLDPQAEVDRVRRALHAVLPPEVSMPTNRPPTNPEPVVPESAVPTHQVTIPGDLDEFVAAELAGLVVHGDRRRPSAVASDRPEEAVLADPLIELDEPVAGPLDANPAPAAGPDKTPDILEILAAPLEAPASALPAFAALDPLDWLLAPSELVRTGPASDDLTSDGPASGELASSELASGNPASDNTASDNTAEAGTESPHELADLSDESVPSDASTFDDEPDAASDQDDVPADLAGPPSDQAEDEASDRAPDTSDIIADTSDAADVPPQDTSVDLDQPPADESTDPSEPVAEAPSDKASSDEAPAHEAAPAEPDPSPQDTPAPQNRSSRRKAAAEGRSSQHKAPRARSGRSHKAPRGEARGSLDEAAPADQPSPDESLDPLDWLSADKGSGTIDPLDWLAAPMRLRLPPVMGADEPKPEPSKPEPADAQADQVPAEHTPEPVPEPATLFDVEPSAVPEMVSIDLDAVQLSLDMSAKPRPDVQPGLPVSAYTDDELDALVEWLLADGHERTRSGLAAEVRTQLGVKRRSKRFDSAVRAAVSRALT